MRKFLLAFLIILFGMFFTACKPENTNPNGNGNNNTDPDPDEDPNPIVTPIVDPKEDSRTMVLKSTNDVNTAISIWRASYTEVGIKFVISVLDDNIFTDNIYDIGFDDNVEFLINKKTNSNGWDTNYTYHFLINPSGKVYFQKANSSNSLGGSFDVTLGVSYGENMEYYVRYTTLEEDGFDGYEATVEIGYEILNVTEEEGFGNLAVCPAMRNSFDLKKTTWSPYNSHGCDWSVASSFILVNQDGTFDYSPLNNVEVLYVGDTSMARNNWLTFASDTMNQDAINVSTSTLTIEGLLENITNITSFNPKKIMLYVGSNEINSGTDGNTVGTKIIELLETLHELLPETRIYETLIAPNERFFNNFDEAQIANSLINEYAEKNDFLETIDLNNYLLDNDNECIIGYFIDGVHFNQIAYNLWTYLMRDKLGESQVDLGDILGDSEYFRSSKAYQLITDANGDECIESIGDYDQYTYFANKATNAFTSSISLTAIEVFNNDQYPKFGLIISNHDTTLFFYIDGSNQLSTQRVGYVYFTNNRNWDWANSKEVYSDINYSNGEYTKLTAIRNGAKISLLVNNEEAFVINDSHFGLDNTNAGVLSFNSHLLLKDPFYEEDVLDDDGNDKGWLISATSEKTANPVSNAIDGNLNTAWIADDLNTQVVTLDMLEVYPVTKVTQQFAVSDIWRFKIEMSLDGTNWAVISDKMTGVDTEKYEVLVTGYYRYLRLTVEGSEDLNPASSVELTVERGELHKGTNIARGLKGSAQDWSGGYETELALDGDFNTAWTAYDGNFPKYWAVEWNYTVYINTLEIFLINEGVWNFEIEVRLEDGSWVKPLEARDYEGNHFVLPLNIECNAVLYRVFSGPGWAHIVEMNVFGFKDQTYYADQQNKDNYRVYDLEYPTYVDKIALKDDEISNFLIEGSLDGVTWEAINPSKLAYIEVGKCYRYIRYNENGLASDNLKIFGTSLVNDLVMYRLGVASDSSADPNFSPKYVTTNPENILYNTYFWCASSFGGEHWLEFDLGRPSVIYKVVQKFQDPDREYKFKIVGSIDGEEWVTLRNNYDVPAFGQAFEAIPAEGNNVFRYIKLLIIDLEWANSNQFQVFGIGSPTQE